MRTVMLVAVMAMTATFAAPASAQRADDKFYAKGGLFFSNLDSSIRIDGSAAGTPIDLEKDFGLGSQKTAGFGLAGWRFSEKWRVELEYFRLSRSGSTKIDRNVTVGNTVYPVNGTITSGLSTSIYRLAVGYSFVKGDGYELGADLGAHLSDFSVFVEGTGSLNGAPATARRETRSQLVPLPTLGLYGRYDLNDTFALVARADYFQLKIDKYKGSLVDLSAGVTARVTKNVGIGADMRYVDYGLRASAADFTGKIDYKFYGPFVYLDIGF